MAGAPVTGRALPTAAPSATALRRRLFAVGALVLAVVGTLAAAGAFSGGSPHSQRAARAAKPAPARSAPLPSGAEITQLLQAYADRYHAKNALGLGELMADDAVRRNDGDPPQNRAQAIAAYRRQFAQSKNPSYVLSGLRVKRAPGTATVTGHYTITSDAGSSTGAVVLHLVERDGHLVIRGLDTTPG